MMSSMILLATKERLMATIPGCAPSSPIDRSMSGAMALYLAHISGVKPTKFQVAVAVVVLCEASLRVSDMTVSPPSLAVIAGELPQQMSRGKAPANEEWSHAVEIGLSK